MAYSYTPSNPDDEEEEKRRGVIDNEAQEQPAATTPDPGTDADPFRRNVTAVPGNPETRYGGKLIGGGQLGDPSLDYIPKSTVQTEPGPQVQLGTFGNVSGPSTRAAQPDAFDRPVQPQLLVPSPAVTNVAPTSPAIGAPAPTLNAPVTAPQPVPVPGSPTINPNPAIGGPSPAVNPLAAAAPPAIAPAIPPPSAPVSPFPGTLPGSTPQANAQPVQPRDIIPDDEDAFRQRRRAY